MSASKAVRPSPTPVLSSRRIDFIRSMTTQQRLYLADYATESYGNLAAGFSHELTVRAVVILFCHSQTIYIEHNAQAIASTDRDV